jgi:Holliday junction DNA helicase RuvA
VIARLTGTIVECRPAHVVLDVAGVGYRLSVSLATYCALTPPGEGRRVTLHVYTHVREDALQLYGFAGDDERSAFEELLAVSGVGPKLALTILSGVGADELRACVSQGDAARLQKIPGVGKKTAERLVLELKHRWDGPRGRVGMVATPGGGSRPTVEASVRDDAVSALVNLGYPSDTARRMVEGALVDGSTADLGTLLREALGRAGR